MLYFEDPELRYHHTKAQCLAYQNSEKPFEEIKQDVEGLKEDMKLVKEKLGL